VTEAVLCQMVPILPYNGCFVKGVKEEERGESGREGE
jgi:hypothetical protein